MADLLIINNFVATPVKNNMDAVLSAFSKYKNIIANVRTIGIVRDSLEEQKQLLVAISSYGPSYKLFFENGKDRYYIFENNT